MMDVKVDEDFLILGVFPCLMKRIDGNEVVLFTAMGEGTVLQASSESSMRPVGFTTDNWRMSAFKPFYGTVTLSNS